MAKKIKKIGPSEMDILREAVDKLLESLLKKYGVHATTARGSYSNAGTGSFKLELSVVGDDGVIQTKESRDFLSHCDLYGLSADDLDKEFTHAGDKYRIVGLKRNASVRPIVCDGVPNGKGYVFPPELVARALAKQQEPVAV